VVIQEDSIHGKNLWLVLMARPTVTPGLTRATEEFKRQRIRLFFRAHVVLIPVQRKKRSALHRKKPDYNNLLGNAWTFPGFPGKSAA
jgi:hypothetical protein